MNQGGPGDHPLTDLLTWGKHPFPDEIETAILGLRDVAPRYLDRITSTEFFDWASGRNLESGKDRLRQLLVEYEADLKKLTGS